MYANDLNSAELVIAIICVRFVILENAHDEVVMGVCEKPSPPNVERVIDCQISQAYPL